MKCFLSPLQIKPNNKSITLNDTAFKLMYYNVSGNKLTELIHNTITLTNDIRFLVALTAELIILYVIYIFLYFRVFIRDLSPSSVFHSLLPIVVELIIVFPYLFL